MSLSNIQSVYLLASLIFSQWYSGRPGSFTGQSPDPPDHLPNLSVSPLHHLSPPSIPKFLFLIELYVTQHPSVLCRQLKTNTVQIKLLHATSDILSSSTSVRWAQYGRIVGVVKKSAQEAALDFLLYYVTVTKRPILPKIHEMTHWYVDVYSFE